MPDYALLEAAGSVILQAEAFDVHRSTLASDAGRYGRAAFASLLSGAGLDAGDLAAARRAAALLGRRMDSEVFARHDALLTVNTLTAAPSVAPYREGLAGWTPMRTLPFNVTGHPALAVPAGFAAGLPVGVQIAGPAGSEALICQIGHAFEVATDHSAQRPQPGPPVLGQTPEPADAGPP
jgi:aspartyl-tRNA(Asn)/glutamyl-tRNA(Gln) amidotransferase subunit A